MTSKGGDVYFVVKDGTLVLFSINVNTDPNLCLASVSTRVLYEEVMIMAGGFEQSHDEAWAARVTARFQSASRASGNYDEVSSFTSPSTGLMCKVTAKETWSATKE